MVNKYKCIVNLSAYFLLFLLIPILTFSACGQYDESQGNVSTKESQLEFKIPAMLKALTISEMSAELQISGAGTHDMTVNPDGTVAATVTGIPAGSHTFTITYYYQGSIILAQASTSATVKAGQTTNAGIANGGSVKRVTR